MLKVTTYHTSPYYTRTTCKTFLRRLGDVLVRFSLSFLHLLVALLCIIFLINITHDTNYNTYPCIFLYLICNHAYMTCNNSHLKRPLTLYGDCQSRVHTRMTPSYLARNIHKRENLDRRQSVDCGDVAIVALLYSCQYASYQG